MRMHVPLGKPQPWVIPVTIVCLALGALLASLYSASTTEGEMIDTTQMNRDQLAMLYAQAVKENNLQASELETLREQQNKLTNSVLKGKAAIKELNELRVRAGSLAAEGPGIVITIDDTNNTKNDPVNDPSTNLRIVHDSDLLTLVNELRSAGAEAIEINGVRVIGTSAIRCAGSVIQVNYKPIAPPFIITAIGKPETLSGAMNLPNGVFDWLRPLGIQVNIEKRDKVQVAAISTLAPLEYAKPAR